MPHTPKIMKNNKIMPSGTYAIYSQEIFKMPTYLKILILRVLLKKVIRPNSKTKKKQLYGPFLWMGFNCLKARATLRRQFTFYH